MTENVDAESFLRPINAVIAASLLAFLSSVNLFAIWLGNQASVSPFPFSPYMSLVSAVGLSTASLALAAKLLRREHWATIFAWLLLAFIPATILVNGVYGGPSPQSDLLSSICLAHFAVLVLTNKSMAFSHITRYDFLVTTYTLAPLLSVFAYIFDPVVMYDSYAHWVLPVPTALGHILCFIGLIGQTYSKGAAGLLTRNSHYARNFQWLLLLVLIVPLSIGSSLALAVDFGYVRAGFAAAIFCLLTTLLVSSVLANNAIVQENWLKKLLREQKKNSALQNHISEILELSPDAILLLDRELRVLHANRGAAQLFGWQQEELQNIGFGTLIPSEHYLRFERLILRFFSSRRLALCRFHPLNIIVQNRLGELTPVSLNLSKRSRENAKHIVAVFRNISATTNKIHSLEQQLKVDVLTGAGSRAEFESHCEKLSRSQRKHDDKIAILIIDIDDFKAINDTYGHPTGDRVLQTFSRTTQNCLRNGDLLFRIGGEEFAIVAQQIGHDDAHLLADRIRTIIKAKPMVAGPNNLYTTCSVGACLSEPADISDAIQQADKALYQAKRNGKDQVVIVG